MVTLGDVLRVFPYDDAAVNLGIANEELAELATPLVVTTSLRDVFEEHLGSQQNLNRRVAGRLVFT